MICFPLSLSHYSLFFLWSKLCSISNTIPTLFKVSNFDLDSFSLSLFPPPPPLPPPLYLHSVSLHRKKMTPFIPLSFFFLLLQCPLPSISTNSEGNALNALRSRLSDPHNVLQSWDPTLVNPCTWFHVTCDSNNHVTRLDLGNSNVTGTLGPELGELHHLQYLELYRNDIRGKIPKEFGNLKKIVSLDLYDNKFEGEIPKSFSKLKSLRFLRLNNNKLSGPIPRQLTRLTNLKVFDVSNNILCGTIPVDGPFASFPPESFANNSKLRGPELKGLVSYNFGC